ncbi:MAG: tetratricopeptide repeat protein [Chromatiales bacterium]|nr:tetratricopeptide repeat protein [Chromatiales bacterium]
MGSADRQSKLLADQFYELLTAEIAIQLDDKQQSLEHYYRAALLTEDREVYRSTIALAVNLGDYEKARAIAENWYRLDAEDRELNQVIALIYLQLEDYEKALQHIEILLADDNSFERQPMLPLLGTLELKKSQEILDKFEQAVPGQAAIYWLRAYLDFYYGRYPEALTNIEQALVYKPDLIKAIALKTDILFALSKDKEALAWLSEQAALHQQSFLLQAKAALTLQEYGHILPAQGFYQTAYDLNSEQATFILQYIAFNISEDNLFMADLLLARYLQLGGNSEIANYYRGAVAEKSGNLRLAISYYRAVGLESLRTEARLNIAKIYYKQGLLDKGNEQFQALRDLIDSEDERIRYYITQASALRENELKDQALSLYDEALASYPDSLSLLYARGMLRLEMEQIDAFVEDMQRVIELDNDNWQALNALGYTLANLNQQLEDASTYIRRAYELNPTDPAVIDSMGWLEFRLNNLELAERYISKAASVFHDDEILGHWVEILLSMEKQGKATQLLNEALTDFPDSDYLLDLYNQLFGLPVKQ